MKNRQIRIERKSSRMNDSTPSINDSIPSISEEEWEIQRLLKLQKIPKRLVKDITHETEKVLRIHLSNGGIWQKREKSSSWVFLQP